MFNKAKAYRDAHITPADTWEEFKKLLDEKGGFISAHWDGSGETEEKIKEETKATIRCIPLDNPGRRRLYLQRQAKPSACTFRAGLLRNLQTSLLVRKL